MINQMTSTVFFFANACENQVGTKHSFNPAAHLRRIRLPATHGKWLVSDVPRVKDLVSGIVSRNTLSSMWIYQAKFRKSRYNIVPYKYAMRESLL